ncbi:hypothetical protein [Streptomyces bambusae]|uniref:Bulb-type lectin domain-containing protein n=1 Tax=Streptomyces bambusae TaxID=1550616 RepID=A0ABS6YZ26_9ACTN|nr:hypothetical protein [Streptomyces bambusae]MBW5480697.1 hypothetical protein [Streptomyces bambusae]
MTVQRKRAAWTGAAVTAAVAVGVLVAPAAQAAGAGTAPVERKAAAQAQPQSLPKAPAEPGARSLTADTVAPGLKPGEKLLPGQSIGGANAYLKMQDDGNLVLIHNAGADLWATGTYGNPGAYAVLQADGNFVVYSKDGGEGKGGALWHSATWGNANSRLDLQEDGNLVLYRENNSAAWSSRTWRVGDNTLSSGENLDSGTWMQGDNHVLVMDAKGFWFVIDTRIGYGKASTTYSPGAYMRMQADGNLVIYKKDGGEGKGGALWYTGTYNNPGAHLDFGRDGSLRLVSANGSVLKDWETQ